VGTPNLEATPGVQRLVYYQPHNGIVARSAHAEPRGVDFMFVFLARFSQGLLVPLSTKYADAVLPGLGLHERVASSLPAPFSSSFPLSLLADANTPVYDAPGLSLDALIATVAPLALLVALVLGAKGAWGIFSKQF